MFEHPAMREAGPILNLAGAKQTEDTATRVRVVGSKDLARTLDEVANCLAEGWAGEYQPARSLDALRTRLRETRFHLAVVGQFKRGKSTLINALLGAPLLPSAAVPVTAIPTFITWASQPAVRVVYQGDHRAALFPAADAEAVAERLREFVTEQGNPENRRGVARVELHYPADILRDGVVLIDTPGIGSTLRHNTDAALEVLPQCDAGLFVVSADPPITEAELQYLARVRGHVVHLFFVVNKIDYLPERERAEVQAFLQHSLRTAGLNEPSPAIYPLSARQALDVVEQAIADLWFRVRTMELPLSDLAQRAASFESALSGFRAEREAARDLLAGDRRRAVAELESQAERLRGDARHYLRALAEQALQENGGDPDEGVQRAVAAALPEFFDAKLSDLRVKFRCSVGQLFAKHQLRADRLVDSVRRTAANLFDIPFRPEVVEPFQLDGELYWATRREQTELLLPALNVALTAVLPRAVRQARLRRRTDEMIEAVVLRNVEALRWAALRALDHTFHRFEAELDQRLAQATASTEGAIRVALDRRNVQSAEVDPELTRLRRLIEQLSAMNASLGAGA